MGLIQSLAAIAFAGTIALAVPATASPAPGLGEGTWGSDLATADTSWSAGGVPTALDSTNDPSVRAAVEPALFAALAPMATPSGGLCVDGDNLLGITSTCNTPKPPDLGGACVFDGRLLSLKASCSVSVAAPEPGTLFLLAIGALGVAAVRRRQLQ